MKKILPRFFGFYNNESKITMAFHELDIIGIPYLEINLEENIIQKVNYFYLNGEKKQIDSIGISHIVTESLCVESTILEDFPMNKWSKLKGKIGSSTLVKLTYYPNQIATRNLLEVSYSRNK